MPIEAKPFAFDDFGAPKAPAAQAPSVSTGALEEARAQGVVEGRRLAMESIAADEIAQLSRIADAIGALEGRVAGDAEDRAIILETAAD